MTVYEVFSLLMQLSGIFIAAFSVIITIVFFNVRKK